MSLCLRDTFGNTFYTSRWLHDIVKPSHTIRINIVCKTTTSCILRDCIGYNSVSIVCPSVGFGSTLAFYQIRDENRANLKISYSCGHRVSKSARYDATAGPRPLGPKEINRLRVPPGKAYTLITVRSGLSLPRKSASSQTINKYKAFVAYSGGYIYALVDVMTS